MQIEGRTQAEIQGCNTRFTDISQPRFTEKPTDTDKKRWQKLPKGLYPLALLSLIAACSNEGVVPSATNPEYMLAGIPVAQAQENQEHVIHARPLEGNTPTAPNTLLQSEIPVQPAQNESAETLDQNNFFDGHVVYHPSHADFDIVAFVQHSQDPTIRSLDAAEIHKLAYKLSINPKTLLLLIKYAKEHNVYDYLPDDSSNMYSIGKYLTDGYYGHKYGREHRHFLNLNYLTGQHSHAIQGDSQYGSGYFAIQHILSGLSSTPEELETNTQAFLRDYEALFGLEIIDHKVDSTTVPPTNLAFPFAREPGSTNWQLTGGPHEMFGEGTPRGSIDFKPNNMKACAQNRALQSIEPVRSAHGGVVMFQEDGLTIVFDTSTGFATHYYHMASTGNIPVGSVIQTGAILGRMSCEFGLTSGHHTHFGFTFQGEILDLERGSYPITLEGHSISGDNTSESYDGYLENVQTGKRYYQYGDLIPNR